MSDTTTAAVEVTKELGKIAVRSAAETAAGVVGAFAVLTAVGFVIQKTQERQAKKNLAVVSE